VPEFENFLTFAAKPSVNINIQNIAQRLHPINTPQQQANSKNFVRPLSGDTLFTREEGENRQRVNKSNTISNKLLKRLKKNSNNAEIGQKIHEGRINKAGPRRFFTKAANPCFCTFIAAYYVCFILELLALKMNGAMAVLDPEPRLLNANAVEPTKLQLLFRPSGKYMASTHFIHVWVPFNFSKLLETPAQIFEHYQTYINKWPEPFMMQVDEVADISKSCLAEKLNDFTNILVALPEYEVVTRDK
jgi:hypothetical protein